MFEVIPRARWGAKHGRGHAMSGAKNKVVAHHDGVSPSRSKPGMSIDEESAIMRVFENHHAKTLTPTNPRIGYSFVVMQTGRLYEGCGWGRIGAHTGGLNSSAYGWCFPIHGGQTAPTREAINAFRWHVAEGVRLGHIAAQHIVSGHQDHGKPDCPGDKVYDEVVRKYVPWQTRAGAPLKVGQIVWSDYFKDYLMVVSYISDQDWRFVPLKALPPGLKASTALSAMPLVKPGEG